MHLAQLLLESLYPPGEIMRPRKLLCIIATGRLWPIDQWAYGHRGAGAQYSIGLKETDDDPMVDERFE
jgi:hypothetical protein